MRRLFVYILSSKSRTLYVGVTNNIVRRVHQHRTKQSDFTSRYRITRLVYYEYLGPPIAAIRREKEIKIMLRAKKVAMIEVMNPAWDDLADGWYDSPE